MPLLVLITGLLLEGCKKKDDDPAPAGPLSVTVTSSSAGGTSQGSVTPGASTVNVSLGYKAKAARGLKLIIVEAIHAGDTSLLDIVDSAFTNNNTEYVGTAVYQASAAQLGLVTINVHVIDQTDATAKASYALTVVGNPAPTVAILSSNHNSTTEAYVNQGATGGDANVVISYRATAAAGITRVKTDLIDGSSTQAISDITSGFTENNTKLERTETFTVPSTMPAGARTLRVTVTDRENRTATTDFIIKVVATRVAFGLSAIGQGTQAFDVPPSITLGLNYNGNSMNIVNTSSANANIGSIDWSFNYVSGLPRIVGPDDAVGLTGVNRANTKFALTTLTSADFDAATGKTISQRQEPTGNDAVVTGAGQIIMFYNPNSGRKGLVRVTNLSNVNAGQSSGYIEFDVKQNM